MNILLATDGSECAQKAERLLTTLPLLADAHVTVLSAVPDPNWLDTPLLVDVSQQEEAAARRTAEDAANALRERGGEVSVRVRCQNPAAAILEEAQAAGAELIVVGSHGKGAMERFLIGSVSERVARYARCSVMVVRSATVRRVIVAVDSSPASEHALDALARLPLPVESEWQVIHVMVTDGLFRATPVPAIVGAKAIEAYDRERHAEAKRIVRHAQDRLDLAGRTATTAVRCGGPAEEVVTAAREWGADLLVVGAANRSTLGRLFLGSVSGRILSHAPCSVLVARVAGEQA